MASNILWAFALPKAHSMPIMKVIFFMIVSYYWLFYRLGADLVPPLLLLPLEGFEPLLDLEGEVLGLGLEPPPELIPLGLDGVEEEGLLVDLDGLDEDLGASYLDLLGWLLGLVDFGFEEG